jgi:hypothetical protein
VAACVVKDPTNPTQIGIFGIEERFSLGFRGLNPTMVSINPTTSHSPLRVKASGWWDDPQNLTTIVEPKTV